MAHSTPMPVAFWELSASNISGSDRERKAFQVNSGAIGTGIVSASGIGCSGQGCNTIASATPTASARVTGGRRRLNRMARQKTNITGAISRGSAANSVKMEIPNRISTPVSMASTMPGGKSRISRSKAPVKPNTAISAPDMR